MAAYALSPARSFGIHGSVGRIAAIVVVVAITMLGNLRLQASEPLQAPVSPVAATTVADRAAHRSDAVVTDPMLDDDGASSADDTVELVPAIYAWDPDVRFVYFRHVSKWM